MMNYFDLLSPEIIEFIFKKLNLSELINLRIVDKRFKELCEQTRIKQLYLCGELRYHEPFWCYTNDPTYFKQENSIEFAEFSNYAKIFRFDKYLKRLALNIDDFNFSILNEFKLLEQFEITTNDFIDNYKLSLDNLKIVDFDLSFRHTYGYKLTFNTIKLSAFRLMNAYQEKNDFVFNYPGKILFFETNFNEYLYKFINLEYLKLTDLSSDDRIERDILSKFKNLKILDLVMDYYLREYNDDIIDDINFLINEKENLKRSELEIYVNGVKLINQNQLNLFKQSDYNLFEFQIKNYDLLKDNCSNYEINYCDLIKLIKIIPSSFTNKFALIYRVEANDRVDNEDQFIKFLTNLQYLSKLELMNCELTQSFYDKLIDSVYLNDLERLTIEEKKDLDLNFDFISQLKRLKLFKTNQKITNHIDLINKLFKKEEFNLIFKFDTKNYIKLIKNCSFYIRSFYLDDNLKEVDNFWIKNLKDFDNFILKVKDLKF